MMGGECERGYEFDHTYAVRIAKMYWLKFLVYDRHILLGKHLFFKPSTVTQAPAWVQGLVFHDIAYMTSNVAHT